MDSTADKEEFTRDKAQLILEIGEAEEESPIVYSKMPWGNYLRDEELRGFRKYKYSAVDTSPLSNYVMHPFWNWLVPYVPRSIAPNTLTLVGFLLIVLNVALLTYFDFDAKAASNPAKYIPNWIWALIAFNHFWAHTLDGLDGKHARRTNSSSPLGELFDHGLDSWVTSLHALCIFSVFGIDHEYGIPTYRMFLVLWSFLILFSVSHWEKYNTGILYLPWGYDISQLIAFIVYILTAIYGQGIWGFKVPPFGLSPGVAFELTLYAGAIFLTIPTTLRNMYRAYHAGALKHSSLPESMRPLSTILILFTVTVWWAYSSPTAILMHHVRAFTWMTGVISANITCSLIISQMSSTKACWFHWILIPLIVTWLAVMTIPRLAAHEPLLLYILSVFVTVAHVHYGFSTVKQMANFLNVYVFSIEKPPPIAVGGTRSRLLSEGDGLTERMATIAEH